jgi:hypothetical protein
MSRTLKLITTSGLNLYAKPSPIASGTWGDDAVALTANANDGREYTATVGDGDYVVFVQAGASPADTDVLRWTFDSTNINATRAGYIDKLNVTGTLANTDNADDFKADVSSLSPTVVTPVASTVDAGVVSEGVVTFYLDEGKTITITVVDNAGNNVDMTGKTLALTVEDDNQVEAFIVASGSITGANGSVSIVVAAADIDQVGTYCYYLREPSNANRLWAKGVLHIRYAA